MYIFEYIHICIYIYTHVYISIFHSAKEPYVYEKSPWKRPQYSHKNRPTTSYVRLTHSYGVPTIGRLLKMIGLFCKTALERDLNTHKNRPTNSCVSPTHSYRVAKMQRTP